MNKTLHIPTIFVVTLDRTGEVEKVKYVQVTSAEEFIQILHDLQNGQYVWSTRITVQTFFGEDIPVYNNLYTLYCVIKGHTVTIIPQVFAEALHVVAHTHEHLQKEIEKLSHCANEWANIATDSIQQIINIANKVTTPYAAVQVVNTYLVRCQELARVTPPKPTGTK